MGRGIGYLKQRLVCRRLGALSAYTVSHHVSEDNRGTWYSPIPRKRGFIFISTSFFIQTTNNPSLWRVLALLLFRYNKIMQLIGPGLLSFFGFEMLNQVVEKSVASSGYVTMRDPKKNKKQFVAA